MHPRALALLAIACAGPAAAGPIAAGTASCGGDAFSSAQVIERRPPRRGPLASVPDTLCADLAPRASGRVRLDVVPLVVPRVGSGGGAVPYGEWPRPDRP